MALSRLELGTMRLHAAGSHLHHCHKVHNNHSHLPFLSYSVATRSRTFPPKDFIKKHKSISYSQ